MPKPSTVYEYKIIGLATSEERLNEIAAEGWRLVAVHNWAAYFERPATQVETLPAN